MKQSDLAEIFKALSCEQRLKVFQILLDHESKPECCGGMLKTFTAACDALNVSRSTVSHHIKELEQAGLIESERQGQSVCCQINREAVQEAYDFFSNAMKAFEAKEASKTYK